MTTKMKTFHTFKTIAGFEKFLRSGKYPACHSSGCLDYITVGGIVYTMHEYDFDGQSVTWANEKHWAMIEMETANRYKQGYGDAKISAYSPLGLRNDIVYFQ